MIRCVIRFVRNYKYTLTLSLVFAALTAWAAWDGQWWRIGWAVAYGAIVAARVAVPDLLRYWDHWDQKRRGAR